MIMMESSTQILLIQESNAHVFAVPISHAYYTKPSPPCNILRPAKPPMPTHPSVIFIQNPTEFPPPTFPAQKRLPAPAASHVYTFRPPIRTAPLLEPLKRTIPLLPRLLRVNIHLPLILAVPLEAAIVARAAQLGDDRPIVAARVHVVPVHAGEEWMGLHVRGATGQVAEAVRAVDCAERQDEVLGVARDGGVVGGEGDGFVDYSGVD